MLTGAALALAFAHALEPEHDPRTHAGLGVQRFGEVEMAGNLQRRHLPGFRRPRLLVLSKRRYFLPKPAHSAKPCFDALRTMRAGERAGRDFAGIFRRA